MPPPHPAAIPPTALLADCTVRFTRRSGPGGQNRNKVETAAILTHVPTGLVAEANETRSQQKNREAALFRLRVLLALKVRTSVDPHELPAPSSLWQSRTRAGKLAINPAHDDFPALLAEALDTLAACAWDPKLAADHLKISPTQLVKLLKEDPRALALLNAHRQERDLPPLR